MPVTATETKMSAIMRGVLGPFADQGFTAREERDELIIEHDGEEAARISSGRATITEIRSACQSHLIMNHGVTY